MDPWWGSLLSYHNCTDRHKTKQQVFRRYIGMNSLSVKLSLVSTDPCCPPGTRSVLGSVWSCLLRCMRKHSTLIIMWALDCQCHMSPYLFPKELGYPTSIGYTRDFDNTDSVFCVVVIFCHFPELAKLFKRLACKLVSLNIQYLLVLQSWRVVNYICQMCHH